MLLAHATALLCLIVHDPSGGGSGPAASGPVFVNEILADNDTTDRDEAGEFDDWVELHHTGTTAYDLTGHYLSDDLKVPKKWMFPNGTKIAPGGFLRIWCDNQPNQGALHATFKLNDDGEEIGLFAPDAQQNKLLDGFAFGKQKGDRAFGRVPDGADKRFYLWTPTGGGDLFGTSGYARYDTRRNGAASNLRLRGGGQPKGGVTMSLAFDRGAPNAPVALLLAAAPGSLDLGALGVLNLDLVTLFIPAGIVLNSSGAGAITFTTPNGLGGVRAYFQGFGLGNDLSNALAVQFSN